MKKKTTKNIEKPPRKVKGRDIVFLCNGGLGDHINQKPVIDYCMRNYLKNDTISIVSDYPLVWADLVDYVYTTKTPCAVTSESCVIELYPVNKPSAVDYQAAHHTTFTSINLIRREIPITDRRPKLKLTKKDFEKLPNDIDYDNLFLFHPGVTWASRTLSPEVWQGWIDTIKSMGYKTAIIGKNMQLTAYNEEYNMFKGAYELKADYNFIDKLELLETAALLKKSFACVTNDSGILHLAGCFDNFIFGFCSTRLPEYLFTWRGPEYSQLYKAKQIAKDELFFSDYDFNPFIQTGCDTAIGKQESLDRITPTNEEFKSMILSELSKYQ